MSSVKEILGNIKERVSNPFVFSFIVSWAVINWRITVALLWYDVRQINDEGFKTIFELIEHELNAIDMFLLPVSFALIYTFGMPLLKIVTEAFNAWASKTSDTLNLFILKGGKVPIERYLTFRENYQKQTIQLEKIIKKDSEIADMLIKKNDSIGELENEKASLLEKNRVLNNKIESYSNISVLNGFWNVSIQISKDLVFEREVEISNGIARYLEKQVLYKFFEVQKFQFNQDDKSIFFIKKIADEVYSEGAYRNQYVISFLKVNKNDTLVCQEEGYNVKYTRID